MNRRRASLGEHSLSIVFGVLLLLCLAGQAVAGVAQYNTDARSAGVQELSLWGYVSSSSYAVDIAENWQSEYLQFTLYILLTVWLVQRGSSESKQLGETRHKSDAQELTGRFVLPDSPAPVRAGGWGASLYSHSLVLVMGLVFVLSWAAQAVAGRVADNEERMRDLLPPLDLGGYVASPDFWNRTLQNWQSELLAVGSMVVFAIFLRERGSPESKPVGAPHAATGSDD